MGKGKGKVEKYEGEQRAGNWVFLLNRERNCLEKMLLLCVCIIYTRRIMIID